MMAVNTSHATMAATGESSEVAKRLDFGDDPGVVAEAKEMNLDTASEKLVDIERILEQLRGPSLAGHVQTNATKHHISAMDGSRAPASFGILDTLLEVEASRNFAQALREGPQYYNELPDTAAPCHESDLVVAQKRLEDLGAVFQGLMQSLDTDQRALRTTADDARSSLKLLSHKLAEIKEEEEQCKLLESEAALFTHRKACAPAEALLAESRLLEAEEASMDAKLDVLRQEVESFSKQERIQRETSNVVEGAIAQLEQELAMEKTQVDRQSRGVKTLRLLEVFGGIRVESATDFELNLCLTCSYGPEDHTSHTPTLIELRVCLQLDAHSGAIISAKVWPFTSGGSSCDFDGAIPVDHLVMQASAGSWPLSRFIRELRHLALVVSMRGVLVAEKPHRARYSTVYDNRTKLVASWPPIGATAVIEMSSEWPFPTGHLLLQSLELQSAQTLSSGGGGATASALEVFVTSINSSPQSDRRDLHAMLARVEGGLARLAHSGRGGVETLTPQGSPAKANHILAH